MSLDQTCPTCLITEAAGAYCTKCLRVTEPAWIHRTRQSVAAIGRKPPLRDTDRRTRDAGRAA